ncbi:hypothetical protein [Clostridium sp. JS66]|uniref:hypothetical protein n=1 Tax=Clostridium sp. JS66 TaxID=3064705 RepID=UPI00298E167B|nr:hypothetical protein [Clostridium sp. JS66]WPC43849.1 hypothetical protein Q6H37_10335 [Clostridium sp. JS66]
MVYSCVRKEDLKAIDLSYNNKITLEDYDEMTSAIENINSYFLNMYTKLDENKILELIKKLKMKKFSKMWLI